MGTYNFNVIISRTKEKFTIIYNHGEYYLFYDNKEVNNIFGDNDPKELWKKYKITSKDVFDDLENEELSPIVKMILTEINNKLDKPNSYKINIFTELLRTLNDFYSAKDMDKPSFIHLYNNAPSEVKSKALELSKLYDNENATQFEVYTFDENSITIEEQIKERANPTLTKEQKAIANQIKKEIKEQGLIDYLNNLLDDVHIGEHKNILRKLLMQFTIMRGKGSFLSETVAKAEAGKSFEDEIVFNIITPARYVYKLSDVTEASFIRYADKSPYYFNRQTILFGDFGSKKSFEKIESVFNILKELITENEYKASKSKKGEDDWESNELHLKVESIGGAYSTTLNSFTEDDNQLISRTLNSTPTPVEEKDIIDFLFDLEFSQSKQSKARDKAIAKLTDFGVYLLSLVSLNVEIINPYLDVFREYALKSDNPIREFKQQMELFNSYCELTSYDCVTIGEYTVASVKQLMDFMNKINLENALIPYEYDFLKMLMAKGNKYELTIVRDIDYAEHIKDIKNTDLPNDVKNAMIDKIQEEMSRDDVISLIECENNALELFKFDDVYSVSDLNNMQLKELPNKINMLYGFRGISSEHKQRVFFRVSDLKSTYFKRKAYQNIDNVPKLLQSLTKKGYLDKYEYQISNGRKTENLYYLTPMCEELSTQLNLTEKEFNTYWNEYKERTGL